jgi:hypothetical protein
MMGRVILKFILPYWIDAAEFPMVAVRMLLRTLPAIRTINDTSIAVSTLSTEKCVTVEPLPREAWVPQTCWGEMKEMNEDKVPHEAVLKVGAVQRKGGVITDRVGTRTYVLAVTLEMRVG